MHSNRMDRSHQCEYCDQTFRNQEYMTNHIKRYHEDEINIKTVKHISMINQIGDDLFVCITCQINFEYEADLENHLEKEHLGERKSKLLTCHLCNSEYAEKSFRNHMKNMHEITKIIKCKTCDKDFKTKIQLAKHTKKYHEMIKDFKCDKCMMTFFSSNGLQSHIKDIHEKENRYPCELCSSTFSRPWSVKQHVKLRHEGKKVACDRCGKMMAEDCLRKHVDLVHDKIKNFVCKSCQKPFLTKPGLRDHEKKYHEKVKEHKCHLCEKEFHTKCGLRISWVGRLIQM